MTVIIILKKDQLESQGESTTMWYFFIDFRIDLF